MKNIKILLLSNNECSEELNKWLVEKGYNVIELEKKISIDMIKEIRPDFIISYNYRYIINKEIIEYANGNIINLHISLLPWNRGASPNFWSFMEDTPKGVTIHYIDEGLDTGDIIAQKEMYFDEDKETFESSYNKLNRAIKELFYSVWDDILSGSIKGKKQQNEGSYHTTKDLSQVIEKINFSWSDNILEVKNKYKELLGDE